MKKFLLLSFFFTIQVAVFGQLKLTEQFSNPPFTASGNLGTQNSWVQAGSGTDVQVSFRTDNTGALTYPGYTSGRSSVSINRYTSGGSGTDPYKAFNTAIATNVENVLYISFVIRVSAAQNTGDYCLALRSSAGNYFGRLAVRNNGTSVNFGVETDGTSFNWTGNYAYNTNYFIVMRYDNPTGNNNDDVYLWVNPSTLGEPTLGSANASILNAGDNWGGSETISSLSLRQAGTNACAAQFDAFKVAQGTGQGTTAANAAAAWGNLAPQGTALPVKFGEISVTEKGNGIQLNWTAYSELEVDRYIIERSANGREFSRIGEVMALNSGAEIKYDYFDADPLSGTSFYRIINLDRSGKTGYSNIVRVNLTGDQSGFVFYPNPVRSGGQLSISAASLERGTYQIRLFNAAGQQVYGQQLVHGGGMIHQTISLPAALRTGFYTISLDQAGVKAVSKSILIQ